MGGHVKVSAEHMSAMLQGCQADLVGKPKSTFLDLNAEGFKIYGGAASDDAACSVSEGPAASETSMYRTICEPADDQTVAVVTGGAAGDTSGQRLLFSQCGLPKDSLAELFDAKRINEFLEHYERTYTNITNPESCPICNFEPQNTLFWFKFERCANRCLINVYQGLTCVRQMHSTYVRQKAISGGGMGGAGGVGSLGGGRKDDLDQREWSLMMIYYHLVRHANMVSLSLINHVNGCKSVVEDTLKSCVMLENPMGREPNTVMLPYLLKTMEQQRKTVETLHKMQRDYWADISMAGINGGSGAGNGKKNGRQRSKI